MYLYQIDVNYTCFCLEVDNNIIINAPGIAKWTLGKFWDDVEDYYIKKNAKITKTRI
jgi:hypothetical protein